MTVEIKFVGYVEYEPTHFHAEFSVRGHHFLPQDSQMNYETLRRLKIKVPSFPNLYEWRRAQYSRRRAVNQWFKKEFGW